MEGETTGDSQLPDQDWKVLSRKPQEPWYPGGGGGGQLGCGVLPTQEARLLEVR